MDSNVFSFEPLIQLLIDVIHDEENRHILQTDLKPMESLLLNIASRFKDQQEADRETLKIWLQLLHNSLRKAKNILHGSELRQRFLGCLMRNPARLSKQIEEWKELFNHLFQGLQRDFPVFASAQQIVIAPVVAPVISPVIPLMNDVIHEEENRHILQTDLKPMEYLLLHLASRFEELHEADQETLNIWLQLLHNSLRDAKNILYRSGPRHRCLCCLILCNPARLSKQIEEWKVLFNYLFQGIQRDFSVFARAQQIVIAPVIAPVIRLMDDVIQEEEIRHILRTGLMSPMKNLLDDMSAVFTDQRKAGPETLNIWLQLLQNSLTLAKNILHRSESRQRQQSLVFNPVRLSKEIKEWNVHFYYLFQGLQKDFSIFVTAEEIVKLSPFEALLDDVAASRIISAKTQLETWLTDAAHVSIIGVYGITGVGKTSLLQMLHNTYKDSHVFHYVIWVTVYADYKTLDLQRLIAKEINLDLPSNSDIDAQKMLLSANLKKKKFLLVLDDLWSPLDLQELGMAFGQGKQSKLLFSTRNKDLIPLMRAEKSIEIPSLSTVEAWKLFREIAFQDSLVSMKIEECARKIADECKGSPLSLSVVAAAMNSKTSVIDWDQMSLNLMKTADTSFPDTHPRVDPELYRRLRWSYDTLPNSNVKNCFLYCVVFPQDHATSVDLLIHFWIAEGLVRSKQENHLIDMATGHSYANLLVDRCLFRKFSNNKAKNVWKVQGIRVHDAIRDVAIYIGEEEENCVFKVGQQLRNFPDIHNEDCKRISLRNNEIENLPTEFTCPKLVSLFLSRNRIKDVPSTFLVSLPSLKVLDLSHNERISSIPPSVGKLKQLELLRLQGLSEIHDLPREIGHLSSLKFLYLNGCSSLQSLPSEIGKLKNLKKLDIDGCKSLRVIPHEISQLTSMDTLDAWGVKFILEIESEASIWRLKGFRNLTQLRIAVKVLDTQEGIKMGIMGTWLEMRHLWLDFTHSESYVMDDLPQDMQKMSKLQSFILQHYRGSGLPDYTIKFQHLEYLQLWHCRHLSELSPLEWLPNLKVLKFIDCPNLKELGIGITHRASGFLMLEKLVLTNLTKLESLVGPLNNGVWSETTLRRFRILKIYNCPCLKRLPMGMNKLLNLSNIFGEEGWWQTMNWEDDSMKVHLQNLFRLVTTKVKHAKIKESSTV